MAASESIPIAMDGEHVIHASVGRSYTIAFYRHHRIISPHYGSPKELSKIAEGLNLTSAADPFDQATRGNPDVQAYWESLGMNAEIGDDTPPNSYDRVAFDHDADRLAINRAIHLALNPDQPFKPRFDTPYNTFVGLDNGNGVRGRFETPTPRHGDMGENTHRSIYATAPNIRGFNLEVVQPIYYTDDQAVQFFYYQDLLEAVARITSNPDINAKDGSTFSTLSAVLPSQIEARPVYHQDWDGTKPLSKPEAELVKSILHRLKTTPSSFSRAQTQIPPFEGMRLSNRKPDVIVRSSGF
jgi:hypothetical protein